MKRLVIATGKHAGEIRNLTIVRKLYDRRHRNEPPYFGERRTGTDRRGGWDTAPEHRSVNR